MKEIKLTQGKVVLVDDSDFEELSKLHWYAVNMKGKYYACMQYKVGGKISTIAMHRYLMQPEKGKIVDHKDHNGLNNQRENLRVCTYTENNRNSSTRKNATSKYLGVSIQRCKLANGVIAEYYKAQIKYNGKIIRIKSKNTELDAARAYDEAAKKYYGEFANINFKDGILL